MIMDFFMKPGTKIKRWIFLGVIGMILSVIGIVEIFSNHEHNLSIKLLYLFLTFIGLVMIYMSVSEFIKSFISLINNEKIKITINDKSIEDLVEEKRVHVGGPKIVVIGGGTGLSTMLRGLKLYTNNITAIVTVGDDGGGSGKLRADLGMLPPGDIRNCILALADTEPIMEDLLQYRFTEGSLKGQSFGNLFLAAMDGISDSFESAVQKMSSVLAVTGKVLPVTLDDMNISNVMTQPGETDNFAVSDHIKTLMKYSGKNSIEYVIANNGTIPNEIKERYLKEGSELVELDYENIKGLGVEIVETDLVKITKGYVKHDSEHLAQVLMTTILDKKLLYDKKRIMEYMYVSKKIKKN